MVVVLEDHGIALFGTPKCGVTSIYHGLHKALHGKAFQGPPQGIHRLYDTLPPTRDDFAGAKRLWCITVIRDPVKRILSAYSNRIHDHHDLTSRRLRGRKERVLKLVQLLPSHPNASTFFRRYDAYAKASWNVRHHTRSIQDFIGNDLSYFDRVYTTSEIGVLANDLSERMNGKVEFPAKNVASTSTTFESLTNSARQKVLDLTRSDYSFLKDFFTPPAINEKSQSAQLASPN